MRSLKQLALLGAVFAAVLAVVAAPALAARGHEYASTFGKLCTTETCTGEELKEPSGVAVNEATGDVYVVDRGGPGAHGRVVRFNAAGEQPMEFNGSGELAGEGAAAGGLHNEGEIPTGRFEEPEGIAIDNSCSLLKPATCTDPSNGDVYVVDAGHRVIDKYSADGEYLGQINEAEAGELFSNFSLAGVAVDPQGKVWVYREQEKIDGFSNGAPNKFQNAINSESVPIPGPGFAVDSTDYFYVHRKYLGEHLAKLDPAGGTVITEIGSNAASAVSVDQLTNESFIDNLTAIRVSNPAGEEVERLGEEKGEKHLISGAGIGVNAGSSESPGSGSLYVADAATGKIVVFAQDKPEPPRVERESESVVNATADSAGLAAEINPRSEVGDPPTTYFFEYIAQPKLEHEGWAGASRTPDKSVAATFEAQAVSGELTGLEAHVTYVFRAVARNSHNPEPEPASLGEELTFTTEGTGGELVLPDNRGWELVTPPDKQGALVEPISGAGVVQAAGGGDAITYLTNSPTETAPAGYSNQVQVLSSRSNASWSSHDIAIPHSSATGKGVGTGPEYKFFSPELTLSAVQPFGEFIPQLSEEASESTAYLHDLSSSCGSYCFHPLVTGKPGFANVPEGTVFGQEQGCRPAPGELAGVACGPEFLGATENLNHVILRASVPLKSGAGNNQLYEWAAGQLSEVSLLPGENKPSPETEGKAKLGLEDQAARRAISSDGSRIEWEAEGHLYQRDMARGETIELDEGEGCEGCESGGGRFQIASADGSRVLFTSERALSADSGAKPTSPIEADLYECRIVTDGEGKDHCALTDLTPKSAEESAEVQGGILGASEDGSMVYFVAKGVQSQAQNARGEKATPGKPNLYLRREGQTSFITTLAEGDNHDWSEELLGQPTRVSDNGQFLELMSEARLSGYDNRDVATNKAVAEVYLFDAASGKLSCASCDPSGARPVGVEYKKLQPGSGGLVGGRGIWEAAALVAANVPGWTGTAAAPAQSRYQPRYLNDSGRLFFNSDDSLVAQDSNGTEDVYEYEPAGIKGPENQELCTEASETYSARSGGCVGLISSGSSGEESAFLDASESGNDVFFLTKAQLSPIDTDSSYDVYDAHVCTGASPCITYPTVQPPPCTTEASCKAAPTPQPSIFGAPPSATFQGPGNPTLAAAVKAKAKPLTRAQKLTKALAACRKDKKKAKRQTCEKQARKKYGPVTKSKKKKK